MQPPKFTPRLYVFVFTSFAAYLAWVWWLVDQIPGNISTYERYLQVHNTLKLFVHSPIFIVGNFLGVTLLLWWVFKPGSKKLDDGERVTVLLMVLGNLIGTMGLLLGFQ